MARLLRFSNSRALLPARRLRHVFVQALLKDQAGRLWIGGQGGVQFLKNGKFTDFTERLGFRVGEADFWDIHEDRRGALWFATSIGLFKLQDSVATRFTTADGLPSNDVKVVHETRDRSSRPIRN